jgi:RHS repeat-associated protein
MWQWDTLVPDGPPIPPNFWSYIEDSLMIGSRSYELTNHLGNILATLNDKKIGNDSSGVVNYYVAEVLSQSDYYPFGMGMLDRNYYLESYRYGYNGKEKDNEVNGDGSQYDFGLRIYNTRLGRFLSTDPLIQTYPWWSPYQYAGNSPVGYIDLEGAELSKKLEEWGVKLPPIAAGFVDGLVENISIIAMGKLIVDLADDEFRSQFFEAIKTAATDPVGFANMIYEDYKAKAKNILAWNEEGQYETGYLGGELVSGVVSGGAIGKLIDFANKFKTFRRISKVLDDLPVLKRLVGSPCGCLTAETQVLTARGLVPISELQDGEIVFSYNDTIGVFAKKPIYQTYNLVSDTLFYIYFFNETIRATKDHPFYTKNGWKEATNLLAGDSLLTYSGNYIVINKIEKRLEYENVFNFEVEDYHTYFIGNTGVIVHNAVGKPCNIRGGSESGFYRVIEKKGKYYIGKGKFERAKHSLNKKSPKGGGGVEWWSVDKGIGGLTGEETAFVFEHLLLQDEIKNGRKTLNQINSPGRSLWED